MSEDAVPQWYPISLVSDQQMIRHAVRRGIVRTREGAVVRLVRWKGSARNTRHRARCETKTGARFTVPITQIVAMCPNGGEELLT